MRNNFSIKDLPLSERPYEKFLENGPEALSDAELIAIILKTGTANKNSVEVARELLKHGKGNILNLYNYSIEQLKQFEGIGQVKAIQLKAVAELSKRISRCKYDLGMKFVTTSDIADYFMESLRHYTHEVIVAAYFDNKMRMQFYNIVAKGSINCAYAEPRDIVKSAIDNNSATIVLLHNHPSGDSTPSDSDFRFTDRMNEAFNLLGIQFGDHIIIGDRQYYSFREQHYIT